MRRLLRHLAGLLVHIRAGYSPRTYNDVDCGCVFAVPRWLRG